jgi:hypothetical protein
MTLNSKEIAEIKANLFYLARPIVRSVPSFRGTAIEKVR